MLFAAFRYDLADLVMLGYAVYATDRWLPRTREEWLLVGIGGSLMIAAYHAFLFVGEQGTTSAAAALTGFVVLGEIPTRLSVVGFALILVGFVLIKRDALRAELVRLR